jgi:hypothetical protein
MHRLPKVISLLFIPSPFISVTFSLTQNRYNAIPFNSPPPFLTSKSMFRKINWCGTAGSAAS